MEKINKRYYWLKLKDDFFERPDLKKLRRIAGGDTYLIIYQKILLLSIKNNGKIIYQRLEPSIEEELALILGEEIDNVKITFSFLRERKLIFQKNKIEFELPEMQFLIGSETQSTIRSRVSRNKNALHCNANATQVQHTSNKNASPDIDIDKDIRSLPLTPSLDGEDEREILKKIKSLKTFQDYANDYALISSIRVVGTEALGLATIIDKKEKNKFDNEPRTKDPGAYLIQMSKNYKKTK